MLSAWLILLLSTLAGLGPARFVTDSQLETYTEPEAYEIYAVLLPRELPGEWGSIRLVVIKQEIDSPQGSSEKDLCIHGGRKFRKSWGSVLKNFLEVNQSAKQLVRRFPIDKPYVLVPATVINSFFEKGAGGWKAFYARYPDSGGYIEVSAVGFNAEGTKALVEVSHDCGGLCGGGTYHFLEKRAGKWEEVRVPATSCAWAS